jgi:hypothetical protein
MKSASRYNDLLAAAATDLLDMRAPLGRDFLVTHQVNLDECLSLSELIGHILRGYTYAPALVQDNLLLAGLLADSPGLGKMTGEVIFNASLETPHRARPNSRMQSLLKRLAGDFLAGRETFSHQFLVHHQVTADECFSLSEQAGYLLRGYLHAAQVIRDTILICGVAGKAIPGELVFTAGLELDVKRKWAAFDAKPSPHTTIVDSIA